MATMVETTVGEAKRAATEKASALVAGYDTKGEGIPLGGYAVLMGAYAVAAGGFFAVARRELPERLPLGDVALLAIATHKLTRILTLDWVTSPLRAPFTKYEKSAGAAEVVEHSRGTGLRRAVGDLLTCPYCSGPWVALGLAAGLVVQPRITRLVATVFAAVAASDWLHQLYAGLKKAT